MYKIGLTGYVVRMEGCFRNFYEWTNGQTVTEKDWSSMEDSSKMDFEEMDGDRID